LLVLLEGDTETWRSAAASAGWHFLGPWTEIAEKNVDLRIKALEKRVAEAVERQKADENRVYLAGQGNGAAAVFYVATRLPDVWAAAVAVGGRGRPAIDTARLYAANTTNLPVLWAAQGGDSQADAAHMKSAGYNLEFRTGTATTGQVMEWLSARKREPFPATADCETGLQIFPRCYWMEVTRFDPSERNDALASTRIAPLGSGAYLDVGSFGYDREDPGPGALVSWLPPDYGGPLRLKDRIVALNGKPVANAAAYTAAMEQTTDERPVVATVQRGKDRMRLETRVVVPKIGEDFTARVQGRFAADVRELLVMSRAVGQMRLRVPEAWAGASMNWNGTDLGKADGAGCWLLEEKQALLSARKCE
jgi:hypothetical protein